MEGLENELWRRWSEGKGEWAELIVIVIAELILQLFRHFIYVTAHSPTLPSLYLRYNSFSNPSVASLTSQLIFQPFFRFSHVTGSSVTSPGESPMLQITVHYFICNSWIFLITDARSTDKKNIINKHNSFASIHDCSLSFICRLLFLSVPGANDCSTWRRGVDEWARSSESWPRPIDFS